MNESPTVEDFLAHYGVKGMRWGHRKAESRSSTVTVIKTPGKKVRTSGGHDLPPSADAIRTAKLRQKARASSTHSLSDNELKDLVKRMNLEQQYKDLASKDLTTGEKFLKDNVTNVLQQEFKSFVQRKAIPGISDAIVNKINK